MRPHAADVGNNGNKREVYVLLYVAIIIYKLKSFYFSYHSHFSQKNDSRISLAATFLHFHRTKPFLNKYSFIVLSERE